MPGSSTASPLPSRAPSSPEQAPARGTRARRPRDAPHQESASEVVRWAAFSCVLVPVVLVGYGISLAGAGGAALGLAAVTGVCRVLLRQSERCAARLLAEQNTAHRGRHGRTASGAHRGMRHGIGHPPVD
ncbi:hypothetical protein DCW30_05540 [Streptomyces alfalfae]|nr:hypothetical protein D3X13_22445 [Streptomyces fradiae]RXX46492.1 hypothetical protein DCW30_05540 [Streptomyces alfalfae]RZM90005.1 hypothetical protein D4104_25475 [Streptomyces alfalfae]